MHLSVQTLLRTVLKLDIVQILVTLCSQYVVQPALKAADSGINWLRELKDYILNIH